MATYMRAMRGEVDGDHLHDGYERGEVDGDHLHEGYERRGG